VPCAQEKSPRSWRGLNPPKEEGGGDKFIVANGLVQCNSSFSPLGRRLIFATMLLCTKSGCFCNKRPKAVHSPMFLIVLVA
jgi:hypothetical protein